MHARADRVVEQRVVIGDDRLRRAFGPRNRPEWVSCSPTSRSTARSEAADVLFDQCGAQACQLVDRRRVDDELVRVRSSVSSYRDGLATPYQLGARAAEPAPAPLDQFGRSAVGGPVPAFHRQDGEPIADRAFADRDRLRQRSIRGHVVVDRDVYAQLFASRAEHVDGLQLFDLTDAGCRGHGAAATRASRRATIGASSSLSDSGRVGSPGPASSWASQPRRNKNWAALWR